MSKPLSASMGQRKDLDQKLVEQILNGDKNEKNKAISELYKYYTPYFRRYFQYRLHDKESAEDLANDLILRIINKINQYNFKYAFFTWANNMAKNFMIDYIRKESRYQIFSINKSIYTDNDGEESNITVSAFLHSKEKNPYQTTESNDNYHHLRERIKLIHPKYQEIIHLRYFKEMSYQEISEKLDIEISTVKTHLFRAKKELQDLYNQT